MNRLLIQTLCAGAALAAAQASNAADDKLPATAEKPIAIVEGFTVEGVSATLTGLGATELKATQSSNGGAQIAFTQGGNRFRVLLTRCTAGTGCAWATIVVNSTGKYPVDVFNRANQSQYFFTAARFPDDSFALYRTVVAERGITEANFALNVKIFTEEVPLFWEDFLKKQTVAGKADDKSKPVVTPVSAPTSVFDGLLPLEGDEHGAAK